MNKRVIFTWIYILIPIQFSVYVCIDRFIINVKLSNILFSIFFILFLICLFGFQIFFFVIGTPKNLLPRNVSMLSYLNDIECIQIKGGIYQVHLYSKKLIIDMTGWIFKRQYIRDIILMYYHLNYYNVHKLNSKKVYSKKYFPDKTLSINFTLLNGKKKKLFLIKNGIEKRSILSSMKLLFLQEPYGRHIKRKKSKYSFFDVKWFYFQIK